ncbi:C1 family peptidase [Altererythrobacter sp. Root672]|uniref:C1 family peptidase n=1 Tax=Altererythrobacter sp. Root672 TaxID=1736584 RepID=UPI0009E6FC60
MPADEQELRIDLGEARNQGPRPTCLSFSLSEIHRSAISLGELLSPESLHRRATQRARKPAEVGLTILEATESLAQDGQTTETAWPYNVDAPVQHACVYYQSNAVALSFSAKTVFDALKDGRPIILVIDVDIPFFSCNGVTPLVPLNGSQIQGRHAVVICGFRTSAGKAEYLIKNSWGGAWGEHGHAWLTTEYVLGRTPQLIRI